VPGQLTHRESKDQQQDPAFFCVALQTSKTLFTNESKLLQWLADSSAKTKFN